MSRWPVTVALLVVATFVAAAGEHTKDAPDAIKKALAAKKAIFLDVREPAEWDKGHLKDARLAPLSKLKDKDALESLTRTLPKDQIIYCHCAAGVRCLKAAAILKEQGYDVRPLKEGYKDLLKLGFPKAE